MWDLSIKLLYVTGKPSLVSSQCKCQASAAMSVWCTVRHLPVIWHCSWSENFCMHACLHGAQIAAQNLSERATMTCGLAVFSHSLITARMNNCFSATGVQTGSTVWAKLSLAILSLSEIKKFRAICIELQQLSRQHWRIKIWLLSQDNMWQCYTIFAVQGRMSQHIQRRAAEPDVFAAQRESTMTFTAAFEMHIRHFSDDMLHQGSWLCWTDCVDQLWEFGQLAICTSLTCGLSVQHLHG